MNRLAAVQSYYANPKVRERIGEYFGGALPDKATAMHFTSGSGDGSRIRERLPLEEISSWMRHGAELNRSLWDRRSLVAHLDIEYVNFDEPIWAYREEERAFALQEPVVSATEWLLSQFGIKPLRLITGRGHHFVWQISRHSTEFQRLADLGRLSASLERLYATTPSPTGELVESTLGHAFGGLGLVMEFLAARIKWHSGGLCEIPVELAAIEAGPGKHGREVVSVDITEYSDPLCSRTISAPFSIYLKVNQRHLHEAESDTSCAPFWFVVPLADLSIAQVLKLRHDPDAVVEIAGKTQTGIPDSADGMEKLISAYESSPTARFHEQYYSEQHEAPAAWPDTYDLAPLEELPPCARLIMEHPNDLLLRPSCARKVVRVMLAQGWHPRHIAGLIRSKYERDYAWGFEWEGFDPMTRADFYARVFTGLFVTGVDDLTDFNCQSSREEGICFFENCDANLRDFRDRLLEGRYHERLAGGTFHRMLL